MPVEFSPKAPIENSPLHCGSVATVGLRRDDSGETFEIEVDDGPKGASRDERAGRRCLGWPTVAAWRGFGDGGLPRVTGLRQQVGVLTQSVAGALDLHDDGVVQQPVEQGGGDDRIAELPGCRHDPCRGRPPRSPRRHPGNERRELPTARCRQSPEAAHRQRQQARHQGKAHRSACHMTRCTTQPLSLSAACAIVP